MKDTKPCPHCGSEKGEIIPIDEDGHCFSWWCSKCNSTGPKVELDSEVDSEYDIPIEVADEVINAWNRRI